MVRSPCQTSGWRLSSAIQPICVSRRTTMEAVMPVQKFAPMTKNFPIFDCDAHVTEPPWLWERAKDWLTKDELEALRNTIWFDPESEQLIVNGKAGSGLGSQRI